MANGGSVERVRAALAAAGHPDTIREFPATTRTAADAAAAIGCTVAQIAKSIVLRAGDRAALVIASGVNRVDAAKVSALLGVTLRRAVYRPAADGESERDEVWVIVDDDGPGIPPHALERVFERFYTDRPEQGFGQNSGLGLSISRQIVEAHSGRIWAENRPGTPQTSDDGATTRHGAGARFVVALPAVVP